MLPTESPYCLRCSRFTCVQETIPNARSVCIRLIAARLPLRAASRLLIHCIQTGAAPSCHANTASTPCGFCFTSFEIRPRVAPYAARVVNGSSSAPAQRPNGCLRPSDNRAAFKQRLFGKTMSSVFYLFQLTLFIAFNALAHMASYSAIIGGSGANQISVLVYGLLQSLVGFAGGYCAAGWMRPSPPTGMEV